MKRSEEETQPAWRQRAVVRGLSAARSRAEQRVQRYKDAAFELMDENGTTEFTIQDVIDRRAKSIESGFTDPDKRIPQVTATQIKEKFGGLRFYFIGGDDVTRGAIELAESMSFRICEQCGKPGRPRNDGWVQTLCDEHAAERARLRLETAVTASVPTIQQEDTSA